MATDTEKLVYLIFHLIRCLLSISIFGLAFFFLLGGCCHAQLRSSKRQWLLFNLCIGAMIFAVINSVFAMLPLAPNYTTVLIIQVCTLQHFLEDVAQGQVAYALVAFGIHQLGPQEWRQRSVVWVGICILFQWACAYLLPLPQYLMSNFYVCLGLLPNQFFVIYSVTFLLALPVFLHLIIYLIGNVFKTGEINTQIYPAGQLEPNDIGQQSLMKYILIMGLLFNLFGYAPKGILDAIDLQLKQSIAIYAALEILPAFFLLIDMILLYQMNKEVSKKLKSACRC